MDNEVTRGVKSKPYVSEYEPFARFAINHPQLTVAQFDQSVIDQINLFSLREDLDYEKIEKTLDRIMQALPAIKHLLAKPIIRLKDADAILPVESVRIVNNRTIVHASVHSELWKNVTVDGLQPQRLLTVQHEDNYVIYENICLVKAVDSILRYVRYHIRLLAGILYSDRELQFNFLDRLYHSSYFLALGKLHVGYTKEFDRCRQSVEHCLERLFYIERILKARLNCPVYKQCKQVKTIKSLKKTNIFRSDKEYHRVYLLLKWFDETGFEENTSPFPELGLEPYGIFCCMLSIFAAYHFNFKLDAQAVIDFNKTHVEGVFGAWSLYIQKTMVAEIPVIRLSVHKNSQYTVLLIAGREQEKARQLNLVKETLSANEYLFVSPNEEANDQLLLSVYDMESFRRIQQILLRAMIYSDTEKNLCPFCANKLHYKEGKANGYWECSICRLQISKELCLQTKEPYFATGINNLSLSEKRAHFHRKDIFLDKKWEEARFYFRNITDLDGEGKVICPICRKVHDSF